MPYLAFYFTISTFEMRATYISIVLVPFQIGVKEIKGEDLRHPSNLQLKSMASGYKAEECRDVSSLAY